MNFVVANACISPELDPTASPKKKQLIRFGSTLGVGNILLIRFGLAESKTSRFSNIEGKI